MAKKAKTEIEILISGDNASKKAFASVEKSLDGMQKSTEKVKKGFGAVDVAIGTIAGSLASLGIEAVIGGIMSLGSELLETSKGFAKSQRTLQGALGMTADEAEATNDAIKDIWQSGFSDIEGATDTVVKLKRTFKDMNNDELARTGKQVQAIAQTFDQDLNKVVDASGALAKEFGLSMAESMDFITSGLQDINPAAADDLLDTLSEYAPVMKDAGFTAEEFYNLLESGAQSGVLGTDKIIDGMKEFSVIMTDGTERATDAMADLWMATSDTSSLAELRGEVNRLSGEMKRADETVARVTSELEAQAEQADELSSALSDAKRELDNLTRVETKEVQAYTDQIDALSLKSKELKLALMDAPEESAQYDSLKSQLESVNSEIDKLNLKRDIQISKQDQVIEGMTEESGAAMSFAQVISEIGAKQNEISGLETELGNVNARMEENKQVLAEAQANFERFSHEVEIAEHNLGSLAGPAYEIFEQISEGSMTVADALPLVIERLNQIEDPIERNRIGVELFGTAFEDAGSEAFLSLTTTGTAMEDLTGKTDAMTDAASGAQQETTAAFREILMALMPLADAFNDLIATYLVPIIQQYAPLLAEWIGSNLPSATNDLKSGFNALMPVIQFVIDGFKTMWSGIKMLISIVDLFIGVAVNLVAVLQGVISPADAVKNVIADLKAMFASAIDTVAALNSQVLGLVKNLTGVKAPKWLSDAGKGVKSFLGFADGGDFTGGKPIVVGERGPEVIFPRASGTVIPNENLGGMTNNVTMSINVQGNADDSTVAQIEQVLNRSIDKLLGQGNL